MPIYNQFEVFNTLPINIASFLMQNNDGLFKLLQYETEDALRLNITDEQKSLLMPTETGKGFTQDTRVFLNMFNDDSLEEVQSQIRIYIVQNAPQTHIVGKTIIGFDVLCHNDIVQLEEYKSRHIEMFQNVINTLNGQEIGGLGEIRYIPGNTMKLRAFNRRFSGYTFTMTQFNV